jgi:hypothetical protein
MEVRLRIARNIKKDLVNLGNELDINASRLANGILCEGICNLYNMLPEPEFPDDFDKVPPAPTVQEWASLLVSLDQYGGESNQRP